MWWQDAITVAVICLIMVSLIMALVSAALVMQPAMAAHCGHCGAAMIDSHLDGLPVCLHCRHDDLLSLGHGHHGHAAHKLASVSGDAPTRSIAVATETLSGND